MVLTDEEFKEVKGILRRILILRVDLGDVPGLYLAPASNSLRASESDEATRPDVRLIISDEDLRAKLDALPAWLEGEELETITSRSYERAIDVDRWFFNHTRRRNEDGDEPPIQTVDETNGITYAISAPSLSYCLTLVVRIARKRVAGEDDSLAQKRFTTFWPRMAEREASFETSLTHNIRCMTIVVESTKQLPAAKLRDLANAYAFTVMYRTGYPCSEYQDPFQVLGFQRRRPRTGNSPDYDTPPARIYDKDAIDYYSMALKSHDPYVAFISFYHVLEFYFDSVFREEVSAQLREMITKPGFSYTKQSELFKVARAISNEMGNTYDRGYGNEKKELEYVLRKFVALDAVRERLDEIESGSVERYAHNCSFSRKATAIDWGNREKAVRAMTKRVYETRNALIHSKDLADDRVYRYRPYKDEDKLRMELPLIQVLAEQVLIGAGKVLRV